MPDYRTPQPRFTLAGVINSLEKPLERTYERHLGDQICQLRGLQHAELYSPVPGPTLPLPTRGICRALSAEGNAGNLISTIGGPVAAAIRPQLVFDRMGVQRIELDGSGPISFPVMSEAGSYTGTWVGEAQDGAELDPSVSQVDAMPRIAIGWVELSRQLRKYSASAEPAILLELSRSIEGVLEDGFLTGNGSENVPLGLFSLPDAATVPFGGASPTFAETVQMVEAFSDANGRLDRAVWLANTATAADMMTTEKATNTGVFLIDAAPASGMSILGRPVFISNYVPDGYVALMDPAYLRTIYWAAPLAILDTYSDGLDKTGSARLMVANSADFIAMHPEQVVIGVPA